MDTGVGVIGRAGVGVGVIGRVDVTVIGVHNIDAASHTKGASHLFVAEHDCPCKAD